MSPKTLIRHVASRRHVKVEYDEQKERTAANDLTNDEKNDFKVKEEHPQQQQQQQKHNRKRPSQSSFPQKEWMETYDNIKSMRVERDAVVDVMGCEMLADDAAEPKVQRYHVLISLLLSSQTNDKVTSAAIKRLQCHGLTIGNIISTSEERIGELIHPVGFWRKKAMYMLKITHILHDQYDDDIPSTADEMMHLPGIGPKMAFIAMNVAWGQAVGIGVDTHVHRISNRLGWVKTKTPEETRKHLESWLPKEYWSDINLLLVGFGQQICSAVQPKCHLCLNKPLCPWTRNPANRKSIRSKDDE